MEKIKVKVSKIYGKISEINFEAKGGPACHSGTKDVIISIGGLMLHSCVFLEKFFPLYGNNFSIVMKFYYHPLTKQIRDVTLLNNHVIELVENTTFEDLSTAIAFFKTE